MGGRSRGAELTGKINRKDWGLNLLVQIFEGRVVGRRAEPTPRCFGFETHRWALVGAQRGPRLAIMATNTILLVEDSPDDAELALRAFAKSKIENQIVVARDGVEALDYLWGTGAHAADVPELPEIVLLDLNLPRLHGLEVLRRLRADARTKYLPVVVLTSSAHEQDILQSYDSGANSYVRKPVDFAQFVEAARQLSVYWLGLNQKVPAPDRLARQ
jgi:two-component system response regulator